MRTLLRKFLGHNASRSGSPFHSKFGGMWIDRPDARAELDARLRTSRIGRDTHADISRFMADGYVVLEGAVPTAVIDRLARIVEMSYRDGDARLFYHTDGKQHLVLRPDTAQRGTRLVESHAVLPEVRAALSSPAILKFLWQVFDEAPVLTQTLVFHNGSEQRFHQDPAFVAFDAPLRMAAAWVALEDIQEGSGELQYMKKSHRLPDYVFASTGRRDSYGASEAEIRAYLDWLQMECEGRGLERERFLAKKGDVLIWHADLAHGGSPITVPTASRQSLVGHFCPASARPVYVNAKVRAQDGPLLYSTYLYTLGRVPSFGRDLPDMAHRGD